MPIDPGAEFHAMTPSSYLVTALFEIARPKHWVKNAFVFAPLIFAKRVGDPDSVLQASLAFILFGLFSSCVYMLNDIVDLERDRQHPGKCRRPLPSGRLTIRQVAAAIAACFVVASLGAAALSWKFLLVGWSYGALNVLYSYHCRSIVILDGMFIAAGFVLRAYAGAVVIEADFSDWLYICAIFVSLFLAFSKRRHEILLLGDEQAKDHRAILEEYSLHLLDQIIAIVAAATVVSYSLYCIDFTHPTATGSMKYTLPFVIYGMFRYLYLVYRREEGGNPTELLLSDRPLLLNGLLWLVVVFWALY